ncbi:MAG TPA: hypothetical protein DGK91_07505 [Clostridium sp.]|nr:hypothetical protein [Clostridium sp.]
MKAQNNSEVMIPPKIKYDGPITIATGSSCKSKNWKNKNILYSELVRKLSNTTRTPETYAEYKKLPKSERDRIKDVGGFVGGTLKGGRRKKENVANRTLLTLDLDYVTCDVWSSIELLWDFAVVMYSTHNHAPDNQRLRLVIPLSRPVLPDEYQAIARMIADDLGIEQFDDTTYEPSRLMFWPSTSSDGDYVFKVQDLKWLNPDDVLSRYTFGWQDVSYWPQSSREKPKILSDIKKQEDPLEKKGIIGAFCRTYTITEAIAEFLSDVYIPGADATRYTYAEGSTTGGVVVYDDKFSYSHHGTDPASNILCNAFDLVRIHKFGHLDEEAKENTPANRLPSFTNMVKFADNNPKVKETLGMESMKKSQEDFDKVEDLDEDKDISWTQELTRTKGEIDKTVKNFRIIIENEPLLKGKIALDEFSLRYKVLGKLPWDKEYRKERDWTDTDDSGLREFIETYYTSAPKNKYDDAISLAFKNSSFHPVRDYFGSLKWDKINRIETLLIDYFGAADTEYTRFVMKKWLVASVVRIYNPGSKFDYVPILCGPPGIGKSTFFKKLARDIWYTDSLKKFDDDKFAMEIMSGKLIIEFGELSNMKKADVETVKAFITRTEFNARLAYDRRATRRLIQSIYCGTTNEKEFLKDKTGNRRFWPVDVYKGKHNKDVFTDLDKEVGQIWAEAIELYKKGYQIHPTEEEEKLAEEQQNSHMELDELEQLLEDRLKWDTPKEEWGAYTFTEIVSGLNLSERLKFHAKQNLKTILAKRGVEQKRKSNKRYYSIPPITMLNNIKEFSAVIENGDSVQPSDIKKP